LDFLTTFQIFLLETEYPTEHSYDNLFVIIRRRGMEIIHTPLFFSAGAEEGHRDFIINRSAGTYRDMPRELCLPGFCMRRYGETRIREIGPSIMLMLHKRDCRSFKGALHYGQQGFEQRG